MHIFLYAQVMPLLAELTEVPQGTSAALPWPCHILPCPQALFVKNLKKIHGTGQKFDFALMTATW